jgi:hypothetical protein
MQLQNPDSRYQISAKLIQGLEAGHAYSQEDRKTVFLLPRGSSIPKTFAMPI